MTYVYINVHNLSHYFSKIKIQSFFFFCKFFLFHFFQNGSIHRQRIWSSDSEYLKELYGNWQLPSASCLCESTHTKRMFNLTHISKTSGSFVWSILVTFAKDSVSLERSNLYSYRESFYSFNKIDRCWWQRFVSST